jgi:teichuronic acid exporter
MSKQRSFLNAVKWAYTGNWGERSFSALFTFILAALLGPRDFGMVSIALVYVLFLQMFLDQGLVAALIQRKDLESKHLDAVFWMNLVLSLFLIGLSIGLSRWWATINHAPGVAALISTLSVCLLLQGLAIVQTTLLKREMNFKALSIRSNASVLVGGVVGLGMAFGGFGVWALVGQQIAKDLTAVILLWRLSAWRPHFEFSWPHLKDLMSFSIANFIAQLGIFADSQASSILLGLLFGPVAVGLYRLADRLMNSIVAVATSSIQAVSLPEFSRLQDKPAELQKSALMCIRLSSAITLPALAGLAAVSTPLIACIGPQWAASSDVLKILCALGMALIFAYFTGPLLQAASKPKLLAILEWARTTAGIIILVLVGMIVRDGAVNSQIMGIALARFITTVFLVTPVFLYILMRICRISFRALAAAVVPSALASAGVVLVIALFQASGFLITAKPVVLLAVEILIGGSAGLTLLLTLDGQLRLAILSLVQRTLRFQGAQ